MDSLTLAEIRVFGGTFAPADTTFCNGQLFEIGIYSAVYSLVGTYYGGNGRTTFGIPDLRGRFPIGSNNNSQGPGLLVYPLGQYGGNYQHFLTENQMPTHNHPAVFTSTGTSGGFTATAIVNAKKGLGDQNDADGHYWATGEAANGISKYSVESGYSASADATMAADAVTVALSGNISVNGTVTVDDTGGSSSFNIQNPYLGLNYMFAMNGLYPSRN